MSDIQDPPATGGDPPASAFDLESSAFDLESLGPQGEAGAADARARLLFRYVAGEEWQEYRAIMSVFAGTFFSEFTPEEVVAHLEAAGTPLDATVVSDRLESLRRWGNLTVSSATGTPTSLADYYRRRNRYLITQAGQEVHDAVERILARVDEVHDISTGRLRALLHALEALDATDVATADSERLADLVRAVFDPHEAFTAEITQFFAAVNQWQNRFDLTSEELSFFAQVLVGYVSERLDEIERMSRPLGLVLTRLADRVPVIVERASRGLAGRVEAAGLDDAVSVTRHAGSTVADWEHLSAWFVGKPGRPSRMERLFGDAVAAVRSLTLNLIRLSRVGAGASSRRADFLRLARAMATSDVEGAVRMATAAFGLHEACHYGAPAGDAFDPVSPSTSWWAGPVAQVPVSLRARGDTASRGRTSPIPDRTAELRVLRRRRELERASLHSADAELLSLVSLDGARVSASAFARLEQLVGRALARLPVRTAGPAGAGDGSAAAASGCAQAADGDIVCTIERSVGANTAVSSDEGELCFLDLRISLSSVRADLSPGAARHEGVAAYGR